MSAIARRIRVPRGRGLRALPRHRLPRPRGIGELLVLNDELREAIVARAPVRQLKELARGAACDSSATPRSTWCAAARPPSRRSIVSPLWRDEIAILPLAANGR